MPHLTGGIATLRQYGEARGCASQDIAAADRAVVGSFTLDGCLALQFQAQFDEERDSSREILDHNADVIHPVDRHARQCRLARCENS